MKLTEKQFRSHRGYYDGYCIHCDSITRDGGTEPDAENYECPECEKMSCLGMDYALMGDHFEFIDEGESDERADSQDW
jgi:hypothetical protein